jgi:DNA topoisomerase-1
MPEQCPECSSPYLLEKWTKAGPVAVCPNADCKYKRELPKPEEEKQPETVLAG